MTRLGSFWRSNTVTIGIVIIIMAFGTILFFQAEATSKLQEQSKQNSQIISQIHAVTEQLNKGAANQTQQIVTLTAHIDCIVTFFSQPQSQRTQTAISDIDTCTLKNANTGSSSTSNPAGTGSSATPPTTQNKSPAAQSVAPTTPAPTPSGGSSQPGFFQRTIVNPIKSIINAL